MTFCALLLLRRIQLVKENYLEIGYTRGGKACREGFKRVQTCIPPVIIPHIDPFCIKAPPISCTLRTQLTKLYEYIVLCLTTFPSATILARKLLKIGAKLECSCDWILTQPTFYYVTNDTKQYAQEILYSSNSSILTTNYYQVFVYLPYESRVTNLMLT